MQHIYHNQEMPRTRKSPFFSDPPPRESSEPDAPVCAAIGCDKKGEFRAPKSRSNLREYQYFCAEHIKEFNKRWNYFDGMDSDAIYAFQKDATFGHRPTWKPDDPKRYDPEHLEAAMHQFMRWEKADVQAEKQRMRLPADQQDALAILDIEHPTTKKEIKKHFKLLAKKYHPDSNRGDKRAEETFKKVTAAYTLLIEAYEGTT